MSKTVSAEMVEKALSAARAIVLTEDEARKVCERLEHDSSWDKCGHGYYSMKRQISSVTNDTCAVVPRKVEFDEVMNDLGWKMDSFLKNKGSRYDGRVFNSMKPFLREVIEEWVARSCKPTNDGR